MHDSDISAIYTLDSSVLNLKSGKALVVAVSNNFHARQQRECGLGSDD